MQAVARAPNGGCANHDRGQDSWRWARSAVDPFSPFGAAESDSFFDEYRNPAVGSAASLAGGSPIVLGEEGYMDGDEADLISYGMAAAVRIMAHTGALPPPYGLIFGTVFATASAAADFDARIGPLWDEALSGRYRDPDHEIFTGLPFEDDPYAEPGSAGPVPGPTMIDPTDGSWDPFTAGYACGRDSGTTRCRVPVACTDSCIDEFIKGLGLGIEVCRELGDCPAPTSGGSNTPVPDGTGTGSDPDDDYWPFPGTSPVDWNLLGGDIDWGRDGNPMVDATQGGNFLIWQWMPALIPGSETVTDPPSDEAGATAGECWNPWAGAGYLDCPEGTSPDPVYGVCVEGGCTVIVTCLGQVDCDLQSVCAPSIPDDPKTCETCETPK
jgi:hypothetical protein